MYQLFHGKDTFLSLRNAQQYIRNFLKENSEYAEEIIDATETETEKIVNLLTTTSLFGQQKVIFLKRLYKNKDKEDLFEIIKSLIESENSNPIVILWEEGKISSATKYIKYFKQKDLLDEAPDLNKRTFMTWLKKELERSGLEYKNDALKEFAERVNYETERSANEIQKMKLAKVTQLTMESVKENITDTTESDIWQLIDGINKGNADSIDILDRLLKQNLDPLFILAMIARNYRQLVLVKALLEEGLDSRSIASKLKIPPFTVPRLISSSKALEKEKLSLIYEKLTSLDYQIKTGQIDPELGITLLVASL